ncbi:hypothetical protein GM658_13285 [Pseudoduganella eburnea]|uniref:Uncharacterized protein n=1 Tax=Massilia eburnea TaxID=1776165 RepID=A0A6L6QGR9_9BURK|nr:hypothetical protein [Massilia eburnea]MTW11572.1 hypothetical protein [Massilia eburnea]
MLSWWVRWLLIATVGLSASMYAMDTVRVASTLPVPPPIQPKEAKANEKKPANAVAKASQMDKVADALEGH